MEQIAMYLAVVIGLVGFAIMGFVTVCMKRPLLFGDVSRNVRFGTLGFKLGAVALGLLALAWGIGELGSRL